MADLTEAAINETAEKSASSRGREPSFFQQNPRAKLLLAAVVLAVIAGLVGVWHHYSIRESTDDAQIDGHITPISARVGGTIASVEVRDNQYVEAGTVLVKLDPPDYQVAAERARADLSSAQAAAQAARTGIPLTSTTAGSQVSTSTAKLQMVQAGVIAAQKQIEAAQARSNAAKAHVAEAQANFIKASRDLERMKQLISKDEISQQQYDSAVAAEAAAQATVESARADFAEAEQSVAVAESHLVQARAGVAQARAELESSQTVPQQISITRSHAASAEARVQEAQAALDQAELNLQYTVVKAPVSGQISKKSVEPGQIIQAGQSLLAIVPLEDIWVTANFKETQLKDMRPGQPVTISVDAFGGRKFNGHVESISAATGEKFSLLPPENATGNYVKVVQRVPVKILFEKGQDPEHLLRPGMSAQPTVITK
jgi:membrane fusion protein, multidrug efflux system